MSYTIAEAKNIMAETQRLLDADARLVGGRGTSGGRVNARAAATTGPPARPESFHDVVVGHMRSGHTQAQAVRLAAIDRPDLRTAFVAATNEHQHLQTAVAEGNARRFRNRSR